MQVLRSVKSLTRLSTSAPTTSTVFGRPGADVLLGHAERVHEPGAGGRHVERRHRPALQVALDEAGGARAHEVRGDGGAHDQVDVGRRAGWRPPAPRGRPGCPWWRTCRRRRRTAARGCRCGCGSTRRTCRGFRRTRRSAPPAAGRSCRCRGWRRRSVGSYSGPARNCGRAFNGHGMVYRSPGSSATGKCGRGAGALFCRDTSFGAATARERLTATGKCGNGVAYAPLFWSRDRQGAVDGQPLPGGRGSKEW